MTIITCFVEPVSEVSNIQTYEDIESYQYIKVLKGSFVCPSGISQIWLRAIRFSCMYTEQWQSLKEEKQDPAPINIQLGFYDVSKHLTAQTVEKLPYMVHVVLPEHSKMQFHESKVLKPTWTQSSSDPVGQHQVGFEPNYDVKMSATFHYSTHAELHSFFNYVPYKEHVETFERSTQNQMAWYYNIQRQVQIARVNIDYQDDVQFEIVMTNVRGKRIIGHYLPPVEVEFEVI